VDENFQNVFNSVTVKSHIHPLQLARHVNTVFTPLCLLLNLCCKRSLFVSLMFYHTFKFVCISFVTMINYRCPTPETVDCYMLLILHPF